MTAAVQSPCNSICRIDAASGWCEGCMRTLAEVTAWATLDEAAKRAVWVQIGRRRVLWRHAQTKPATPPEPAA